MGFIFSAQARNTAIAVVKWHPEWWGWWLEPHSGGFRGGPRGHALPQTHNGVCIWCCSW